MSELDRLVKLMARLRGPDGCPWDREQTHQSLKPYLIEETYEALDAIDREDDDGLRDELGDVLLQIVFHAQLAREESRFTLEDVAAATSEKLIRRHPHVFGSATANTPGQVVENWEAIKSRERREKGPEPIHPRRHSRAAPLTAQGTTRSGAGGPFRLRLGRFGRG